MKAKELKKLFENIDDEVDIIPYILDFEYFVWFMWIYTCRWPGK
jgi:hypothetical protein